MFRIIQILILVDSIIREIRRQLGILLILLYPLVVGCGDGAAANREREHVNAMQRQVTEASREFIAADAEARKGWVAAQQSFEQTRKSIVQQQSDIQTGLDRLETERKAIASLRIKDLLMADSIEATGMVVAALVPLLVLGWLMLRFWQTDSAPEVDDMIVEQAISANRIEIRTTGTSLLPGPSSQDSWQPDV